MTPPRTIDEYIASMPKDVRPVLQSIRKRIRSAAPRAEERISYRMPAFFQGRALVYFGAFKEHIGLYPPVREKELIARAAKYAGPKGNLQFPLSRPMPLKLIADIVKARVKAAKKPVAAKKVT